MKVVSSQRAHPRWGRADFFDQRRKAILARLAKIKSSDAFYDLGCGDASLLIYLAKKCGLEHAVGFENMASRVQRAKRNISEAGLNTVISIER